MKEAADDYHKRAQQEDHDNAVFVLGYNPDTGDIRGAAATLGVGLVNKLRGGLFRVRVAQKLSQATGMASREPQGNSRLWGEQESETALNL